MHRLFPDSPTIVFCLPRSGSKSWKILLPLQVACFKTYLKETSRFSGLSNLSTTQISTMTWAQLSPSISCGCRRILSHGDLLYLSHLDHSATRKLMSFELKVSKIVLPLSSLASFRIRLKSTSTSSGPNSPSNSSTLTFAL